MGSLSAASLLAKAGKKVLILEQNYLSGGCTSSYWRKGFVFETGATTLVGLDKNQPLAYLVEQTGINLDTRILELPMQVRLKNGEIINRFQAIEDWIIEAERVFGKKNQRKFWEKCFRLSQFVWDTSLRQTTFPITSFSDLFRAIKSVNIDQLRYAGYSFVSIKSLLQKHDLLKNETFVDFINAQLLITAQNTIEEVNSLFGAAALCYTNYTNHYVNGGLINLVNPFIAYIEKSGGAIHLRETVIKINPIFNKNKPSKTNYLVETTKSTYTCEYLISGIPINNTIDLYPNIAPKYKNSILKSAQLNSAFQMGIGFRKSKDFSTIHHQIHLKSPLPQLNAKTIFVSLSHPKDTSRTDDPNMMVASVSTHWADPERKLDISKEALEQCVIDSLIDAQILHRQDIIYTHSSSPTAWAKWTMRAYGFVGGYPQYMKIKPWQLLDARLDGYKAYQVGDSVYPGQGIPGVTLGGIIAFQKLKNDWL